MNQPIESKLVSSIRGHGRGWVFTPKEFVAVGDPRSIGVALGRLSRKGVIRRLARGLYDYPRDDPQLGKLSPSTEDIAKALSERDNTRLQPAGGLAANLLGLSQQVPVRVVYLTDGPSRTVKLDRRQIVLKRTTPRNMVTAGKVSGLLIQALRWIGKNRIEPTTVTLLRRRLSDEDKQQLLKDQRYAPTWIAEIMRQVSQSEES